jgi:hippurate hydrolase
VFSETSQLFYPIALTNEFKGIVSGIHTHTLKIDENAIEIGMGMMAWLGSSLNL